MTFYTDIQIQSPIADIGLDPAGRQMYSFNIAMQKRPSLTVYGELIKVLTTAGVGTENVNIFYSANAVIPTGDGPYLSIRITGGRDSVATRTHDDITGSDDRPSAQIVVRGKSNALTYAMAANALVAFKAVRNTNLVP